MKFKCDSQQYNCKYCKLFGFVQNWPLATGSYGVAFKSPPGTAKKIVKQFFIFQPQHVSTRDIDDILYIHIKAPNKLVVGRNV